jgi:nucleoid-associated protein YgaU
MRSEPPQGKINKLFIAFLFSIFLTVVSSSFAQSLGDVAREQREHKDDAQTRPRRVYTNEDLSRSRIVMREPEQSTDPAAEVSAVLEETPAEAVPLSPFTIVWPDNVPLGDVARFYRRQRELEETGNEVEVAIEAPPALDLDFLLPSPLARPLPDFTDKLAAPAPVPEPVWDKLAIPEETVKVQRGDTLWKVAARHLGDGRKWHEIAAANPELKDPNLVRAGQLLRLPGAKSAHISSSDKMVRVQSGDSLWKLAAAQLGNGNAWNCLASANPQIENADRIYPGQTLVIPTRCSTGA